MRRLANMWTFKCECCGKFMKHAELAPGGGASWVFVPDHDFGYEEDRHRCKTCTDRYGLPTPNQNVVIALCCGRH